MARVRDFSQLGFEGGEEGKGVWEGELGDGQEAMVEKLAAGAEQRGGRWRGGGGGRRS